MQVVALDDQVPAVPGAASGDARQGWHRLQRELRWLTSRRDARARAEAEGRWKAIAREVRRHPKLRRWR